MADSPEYADSPDSSSSSPRPSESLETSPSSAGSSRKRRESLSLPLPPGALPPRKRAKTAVEKEQRRVERILRNRQAAQSSREKKRKQLEELEVINSQLLSENKLAQERIAHVETENKALKSRLDELGSQLQAMKSYMEGLKDFKFNAEVFVGTSDPEPSVKQESVAESSVTELPEPSPTGLEGPLEADDAMTLDFRIEDDTSKIRSLHTSQTPSGSSTFSSYSPEPLSPHFVLHDDNLDLLSELPSQLDARNSVAFKTMHHPAAVMSLDLQRLLKFPRILGPWMARLVTTMILSAMVASVVCCSTWQQLLLNSSTQSLLTAKVRLPSHPSQKKTAKTTALFSTRNVLESHLIGTQYLTRLFSSTNQSNRNQQVLQRIRRLGQLLRSRRNHHQESQQQRSRIGKNMRSTSQLSSSRSSRFRHMALAGTTTAVATGLESQWESLRLNNSSFLFSQLLMMRLCDFSSNSSNDLSLGDLRDLRRLSSIVQSADVCVARNMNRLQSRNSNGYNVDRGFIMSRKYCDNGFGV
ncbi:hypothetical protein POJ06DRAFT_244018 [Lipomyces tetrasporus]|uniref:BZIP domain-containing protein n=1 Tax=Lipomyces tetrasporus TaxID=54092 RepID=A0AAD7QZB3_9ASCO|nr:uncharacterized protein POJ06DRAFT_244018 [Lipomyces tetrasporus]KAJ8104240.1 hypothetical protein POJ06DRAFT_244018 [Lipomyces tetrasporus]